MMKLIVKKHKFVLFLLIALSIVLFSKEDSAKDLSKKPQYNIDAKSKETINGQGLISLLEMHALLEILF